MPITFDHSVCCDLNETISREWLMTNGLGGYAAGTVAGVLTRVQHGLLVALPPNAVTPQLLLAKIDEEIVFDQRTYYLGTNEYRDGTLNPSGFVHLETFRLEAGFPIFTYRLGGIDGVMLEKRIWMPHDHNTTYIQYRVLRTATADRLANRRRGSTGALSSGYGGYYEHAETAQRALTLTLLPLSTYRPFNKPQHSSNDWYFQVEPLRTEEYDHQEAWNLTASLPTGATGCTIRASEEALPYHILAIGHPGSQATFIPTGVWYWNFLHRYDSTPGSLATDDLYLPGVFRATLWPDEDATLTIIVSTEEISSLPLRLQQLNLSYTRSLERQRHLFESALQPQRYFGEGGEAARAHHLRILPLTTTSDPYAGGEEYLRLLLQAGDHFLARYSLPHSKQARNQNTFFGKPETTPVLLAEYYSMENRSRDTLISLPGLTLVTERYDEALRILREFAYFIKRGLLPDRLPLPGQPSLATDYESVDTPLWFFYALDYYLRITRNYEFLEELYNPLKQTIDRYIQGTANGIGVDPSDGLLYARQPGKALTWMDAAVDGLPVTPRAGKAVEVNALWYHALSLMHEWSQYLGHIRQSSYTPSFYEELMTQCKKSFQLRFWYDDGGYLYDVVDGPDGDDPRIRPNQLLALSLRHSVLDAQYRQSVFDVVTQHLLTPYGLRTLAPKEIEYCGRQSECQNEHTLHQGSVWPWLLGTYIDALLTMHSQSSDMHSQEDKSLCQEYLWRTGVQLLEPFKERLNAGLLGMCPAVLDGEAPHHAGKCSALALNTGELLRIYDTLAQMRTTQPERMLFC
ncbi:MAG: glycogen debranching enzyme N-terminal domain-containing protein [Chloroflexi bacterium]|nr:glycogen debranching enzyme N-terminal domain-containing protein [Chloroflexota bacterium]